MTTVGELASVVRSKNAEPFITTIDIVFDDAETFQRAKDSGQFTGAKIRELYNLPEDGVQGVYFVDGLNAIKVSFYKYGHGGYLAIGDPACTDTYGAQQHVPIMGLEI